MSGSCTNLRGGALITRAYLPPPAGSLAAPPAVLPARAGRSRASAQVGVRKRAPGQKAAQGAPPCLQLDRLDRRWAPLDAGSMNRRMQEAPPVWGSKQHLSLEMAASSAGMACWREPPCPDCICCVSYQPSSVQHRCFVVAAGPRVTSPVPREYHALLHGGPCSQPRRSYEKYVLLPGPRCGTPAIPMRVRSGKRRSRSATTDRSLPARQRQHGRMQGQQAESVQWRPAAAVGQGGQSR